MSNHNIHYYMEQIKNEINQFIEKTNKNGNQFSSINYILENINFSKHIKHNLKQIDKDIYLIIGENISYKHILKELRQYITGNPTIINKIKNKYIKEFLRDIYNKNHKNLNIDDKIIIISIVELLAKKGHKEFIYIKNNFNQYKTNLNSTTTFKILHKLIKYNLVSKLDIFKTEYQSDAVEKINDNGLLQKYFDNKILYKDFEDFFQETIQLIRKENKDSNKDINILKTYYNLYKIDQIIKNSNVFYIIIKKIFGCNEFKENETIYILPIFTIHFAEDEYEKKKYILLFGKSLKEFKYGNIIIILTLFLFITVGNYILGLFAFFLWSVFIAVKKFIKKHLNINIKITVPVTTLISSLLGGLTIISSPFINPQSEDQTLAEHFYNASINLNQKEDMHKTNDNIIKKIENINDKISKLYNKINNKNMHTAGNNIKKIYTLKPYQTIYDVFSKTVSKDIPEREKIINKKVNNFISNNIEKIRQEVVKNGYNPRGLKNNELVKYLPSGLKIKIK